MRRMDLSLICRKYADEVDENYTLGDIQNLKERQKFAEELDRSMKDKHDPVTELDSAWVIEKQAYNNEPDQVHILFYCKLNRTL